MPNSVIVGVFICCGKATNQDKPYIVFICHLAFDYRYLLLRVMHPKVPKSGYYANPKSRPNLSCLLFIL